MFKLFYAPNACSLSPHVALREAELPFELEKVDFMRGKRLASGADLMSVNPKGYVPAMLLDDGQLLTEGAVMVQYIADLAPAKKLAPPQGSFERVRLQEWLNFIATELHKGFSPLFSPVANEEYKTAVKEKLAHRFSLLATGLGDQPWLTGQTFTVADGYALYVMRTWVRVVKTELPGGLPAYLERIQERPSVQAALAAEGLSSKP
ncbi:MAG TPA: glutathione transferase GstA [Polyangiaceae bacterium]|jgi:glutathione S-transferase|nr:glutathione transferase GstA [Polyangiaceae bacterium]